MTKEQKLKNILSVVFQENVDTFTEVEARNKIIEAISELKIEDSKYDNLNYSIFIKDTKKKKWKSKEHFFKVFYDEVEYIKDEFELKDGSIFLLFKLGKYLKWEMNLLVDEEDCPMNQSQICKKLNVQPKTFRSQVQPLVKHRIILPITCGNEVFYFVNPHIMYTGTSICNGIVELFEVCGYKNRNYRESNLKKVEKRCKC